MFCRWACHFALCDIYPVMLFLRSPTEHVHAAQGPHSSATPSAPDKPPAPGPMAKAGPGAALGSWAEATAGREAVEKVYERSGSLNGDAVVIFARALAAVSQEELVPVRPGEAPRCAFYCLSPK